MIQQITTSVGAGSLMLMRLHLDQQSHFGKHTAFTDQTIKLSLHFAYACKAFDDESQIIVSRS
jgi:hypothetical protein